MWVNTVCTVCVWMDVVFNSSLANSLHCLYNNTFTAQGQSLNWPFNSTVAISVISCSSTSGRKRANFHSEFVALKKYSSQFLPFDDVSNKKISLIEFTNLTPKGTGHLKSGGEKYWHDLLLVLLYLTILVWYFSVDKFN